MKDISVLILAAGKSSRMKSKKSKVLHPIAGKPLLYYPLKEIDKLKPEKVTLVVGDKKKEEFKKSLESHIDINNIDYSVQPKPMGTGDAVLSARSSFSDRSGYLLIIPGDVPLIRSTTMNNLIKQTSKKKADCGVISVQLPDPSGYGRIIRDKNGKFLAIREEKDATAEEKRINEINTGIIVAKIDWLMDKLSKIKSQNAQKEYYLTDIIELSDDTSAVEAFSATIPEEFVGVNTRSDLAYVSKVKFMEIAEKWMDKGVTIEDPANSYIDEDVKISSDTVISPCTFLRGKSRIGENCRVDVGSIIEDSTIGDNVLIKPHSVIESAKIKTGSVIGPFARIRPESVIGELSKVGNFVEVKKSTLKKGVKASHLSYIGDAVVGEETNIGCGTITCNYDGKNKHKTNIGKNVFVGSDTQFIAPVKIGDGAIIGAGSTITKNVPNDALALSRTGQENIKDGAIKHRKKKK